MMVLMMQRDKREKNVMEMELEILEPVLALNFNELDEP